MSEAPTSVPTTGCVLPVTALLLFETAAGAMFIGAACSDHLDRAIDWMVPALGFFGIGLTIIAPLDLSGAGDAC